MKDQQDHPVGKIRLGKPEKLVEELVLKKNDKSEADSGVEEDEGETVSFCPAAEAGTGETGTEESLGERVGCSVMLCVEYQLMHCHSGGIFFVFADPGALYIICVPDLQDGTATIRR